MLEQREKRKASDGRERRLEAIVEAERGPVRGSGADAGAGESAAASVGGAVVAGSCCG